MNMRSLGSGILVAAAALLAGCSDVAPGEPVDASQPPGVTTPSVSPDGLNVLGVAEDSAAYTLANASDDPKQFVSWTQENAGWLAVEGTVVEVTYDTLVSHEGVDEKFDLYLPMTYFTFSVDRADKAAPETVRVQVGGAYLPVSEADVAAGLLAPVTKQGEVVQFSMPGGGKPAEKGDRAMLFLRPVTKPDRADYVVVGQSYGYFRLDAGTGLYEQAAAGPRDVTMSQEQVSAALG